MERITSIENVQSLIKDSWENIWSSKIVEQAHLECSSNGRLNSFMKNYSGTMNR